MGVRYTRGPQRDCPSTNVSKRGLREGFSKNSLTAHLRFRVRPGPFDETLEPQRYAVRDDRGDFLEGLTNGMVKTDGVEVRVGVVVGRDGPKSPSSARKGGGG